ncbi:MAG: methylmalonyl-CoA mutase [Chloroflexi bacterium]|nr:methylmalonyl-CoA mutase [Chloroflexota bacterium]
MEERKVRFVLAKLGLNDHTRPLFVLSQALRDAGMEVIYLGLFQTPERVVKAAIAEDADAIGLSFHTMHYIGWVGETINLLKENKAEDVCLFVGGVIPADDKLLFEKIGVDEVFRPGTPIEVITSHIKEIVKRKRWHVAPKR